MTDRVGVRAFEASAGFGVFDIARDAQPARAHEIPRALGQHVLHVVLGEPVFARATDTGGNAVEQLLDEPAHVIAHIGVDEIGTDHAHAAVDVVADAAG